MSPARQVPYQRTVIDDFDKEDPGSSCGGVFAATKQKPTIKVAKVHPKRKQQGQQYGNTVSERGSIDPSWLSPRTQPHNEVIQYDVIHCPSPMGKRWKPDISAIVPCFGMVSSHGSIHQRSAGSSAAVELALKKGDLVTVTEDDFSVLLKSTNGEVYGNPVGREREQTWNVKPCIIILGVRF